MLDQTKPEGTGTVFGVVCCLFGSGLFFSSFDMHSKKTNWLALQEEQAVTIDPNIVDPKNEGKLIHVIGEISPNPQNTTTLRSICEGEGLQWFGKRSNTDTRAATAAAAKDGILSESRACSVTARRPVLTAFARPLDAEDCPDWSLHPR